MPEGFKFPPPPPPPPKSSTPSPNQNFRGGRGGRGGHRGGAGGDRASGHGNRYGRGGGHHYDHNDQGSSRGGLQSSYGTHQSGTSAQQHVAEHAAHHASPHSRDRQPSLSSGGMPLKRKSQEDDKPSKQPRVPAAPAVPSFGSLLPTLATAAVAAPGYIAQYQGMRHKRQMRQMGHGMDSGMDYGKGLGKGMNTSMRMGMGPEVGMARSFQQQAGYPSQPQPIFIPQPVVVTQQMLPLQPFATPPPQQTSPSKHSNNPLSESPSYLYESPQGLRPEFPLAYRLSRSTDTWADRSSQQSLNSQTRTDANSLGLTPSAEYDIQASEDEDDDADEEATLSALVSHDSMKIEHRGKVISLNSPEALKEYMKQRSANYATQERVAARKAQAAKDRQEKLQAEQHQLRMRLMHSQRQQEQQHRSSLAAHHGRKQSELQKQDAKIARLKEKLAQAESKREELARSVAADAAAAGPEQNGNTADASSTVENGQADDALVNVDQQNLDGAPALEDDNAQDFSSDNLSSDDSADEAPVEQPSNQRQHQQQQPPPVTTAVNEGGQGFYMQSGRRMCKYYQMGRCRKGARCNFAHESSQRSGNSNGYYGSRNETNQPPRRRTLAERLHDMELSVEDAFILDAIKALGPNLAARKG